MAWLLGNCSIWQMCLRFQRLSEAGMPENGSSTPFFTSVGGTACGPAAVHSLLSVCWKLRSRKQHSPKTNPPTTRKAQGYHEWMLSRWGRGGRKLLLFLRVSGFLAGHGCASTCICVQCPKNYCSRHSQFPLPSPWNLVGRLVTIWIHGQTCSTLPLETVGSRPDSGF